MTHWQQPLRACAARRGRGVVWRRGRRRRRVSGLLCRCITAWGKQNRCRHACACMWPQDGVCCACLCGSAGPLGVLLPARYGAAAAPRHLHRRMRFTLQFTRQAPAGRSLCVEVGLCLRQLVVVVRELQVLAAWAAAEQAGGKTDGQAGGRQSTCEEAGLEPRSDAAAAGASAPFHTCSQMRARTQHTDATHACNTLMTTRPPATAPAHLSGCPSWRR